MERMSLFQLIVLVLWPATLLFWLDFTDLISPVLKLFSAKALINPLWYLRNSDAQKIKHEFPHIQQVSQPQIWASFADYPRWSLISASLLFSSKLYFSQTILSSYRETPPNDNVGLTISWGRVLRVQDAGLLQRSDAWVHQLQAGCELLLDVLLSICMCRIGNTQTSVGRQTQPPLPPPDHLLCVAQN